MQQHAHSHQHVPDDVTDYTSLIRAWKILPETDTPRPGTVLHILPGYYWEMLRGLVSLGISSAVITGVSPRTWLKSKLLKDSHVKSSYSGLAFFLVPWGSLSEVIFLITLWSLSSSNQVLFHNQHVTDWMLLYGSRDKFWYTKGRNTRIEGRWHCYQRKTAKEVTWEAEINQRTLCVRMVSVFKMNLKMEVYVPYYGAFDA